MVWDEVNKEFNQISGDSKKDGKGNQGGKGFRKEAQTVGEFPRRSDRLKDQQDINMIEKAKESQHRDAIADAGISSGS